MSQLDLQHDWLEQLRSGAVSRLFDYLPNTLYFAKDRNLRLMAGNRAFIERCGFDSEEEMIGKTDQEIFPMEMAEKYSADDRTVMEADQPLVEIVELFPNRMGEPEWFITDKIPLHYRTGEVAGVCGMVRSFEGTRTLLEPYMELLPVTDYLKKNYMNKVAMSELAKSVGMSVRKLQRSFQATFQTTPQKYICKLRVLQACDLLAGTMLPVTEIALQVGFYDHSAFSKKFSEIIGVTPREYRRRFTK